MRVERTHHDHTIQERRLAKIDLRPLSTSSTLKADLASHHVHVNPSAFFMPVDRIVGLRLDPSLFHRLLNGRIIQQLGRGWWSGQRHASAHSLNKLA
jgi:hypothetical protein